MSKLVDKYNDLKLTDDKYYIFKVGTFYIFIDDDAKDMSDLLSLLSYNSYKGLLKHCNSYNLINKINSKIIFN